MWEILEKHEDYKPYRDHEYSKFGMRSSEHDYKKMLADAYECGFEEGYTKALHETEHSFGERRMKR